MVRSSTNAAETNVRAPGLPDKSPNELHQVAGSVQKAKRIYSLTIGASGVEAWGGTSILIVAASPQEAEKEAKVLCFSYYPTEQGWFDHCVSVNDATQVIFDLLEEIRK